eukprot:Skav221225  [mRNA]  locus=scaffold2467:316786:324747:+ [translate_table: standard]
MGTSDQDADEDVEEEDDDDDEWNPVCQGAAMEGNSHEDVADDQDEEDEADSDSDWAPEVQGAANVEKSEEEALKVLLQPNFVKETAPELLDSKFWDGCGSLQNGKEADAAGRMLHELRRPCRRLCHVFPCFVFTKPPEPPELIARPPTWEEVKSEIPRGPDVDPDLLEAPQYKDMSQEEALDLVRRGETPLHVLAKSGSLDEAISKSRRNSQDLAGFTPLMWAAGRDSADGVKMLLDCEADLSLKAARGQTAMTFALTNGCNAIVDILDKQQAILDAEEALGGEEEEWTETLQLPKPDWACKHDKPETVQPYAGRRIYAEAKPDRFRASVQVVYFAKAREAEELRS